MNRKEFFNKVKNEYYETQSISLENFCKTYKKVAPIFGELEVKTEKLEDGEIKLIFIDKDEYDFAVNSNGEIKNNYIDMSSVSMVLYLDKNGVVKTVENSITIFTPANKDLVLFCGSLIEKRINLY